MLKSTKCKAALRCIAAFSLVEVTLALGIAAFCLIAVIGIIPVGVKTTRDATSQTAATNIMAAVIADLRATTKTIPNATSPQFGITFGTCRKLYFSSEGQVVASGPCDQVIALPPTARYQVNVTWSDSGATALRYADLKVTWPAAATAANASGSTEMFAAFDRN
jgi:uncharacterized protein (TIGR02598 family)